MLVVVNRGSSYYCTWAEALCASEYSLTVYLSLMLC